LLTGQWDSSAIRGVRQEKTRGHDMAGNTKERWVEICEQAAVEQDSKKLQKLLQELDRLLREKHERICNEREIVSRTTADSKQM
jgi:hypothetical protein